MDFKTLFAKYWWALPIVLVLAMFLMKKPKRRQKRRNGRFVSTKRSYRPSVKRSSAKYGSKAYWSKWAAKMRRARNRKKRKS